MAIATSNEYRISSLIRMGLNNGESIGAMLNRFYRACIDVHHEWPKYNPKGFTVDDYMVGLCVLRLGGARLADLLHRTLGLPSLTTLRKHSVIRPLLCSTFCPTIQPRFHTRFFSWFQSIQRTSPMARTIGNGSWASTLSPYVTSRAT
jgi:hypothetical protein